MRTNKLKTLIAAVLLMASVMLLTIPLQLVEAQVSLTPQVALQYPEQRRDDGGIPLPAGVNPDLTFETIAYISFRPNPVGLDQPFLINIWVQPPLHASRYAKDYTVTITKPDGTKDTIKMDSFWADTTGWFEYIADQIGEWKLKFDYPGGYYPAGIYLRPAAEAPPGVTGVGAGQTVDRYYNFSQSVYYKPASTGEKTLIVQQDWVWSWPPSPLPTDYWTRPVSPEHREWAAILGNFPWHGPGGGSNWPAETNLYASNYDFTAYVEGPKSAHVMWKRQGAIAGLSGAGQGYEMLASGGGSPSIIYAGRCYQSLTKVVDGKPTSVWQCYDLRTGEVFWERTDVSAPSVIEYYKGAEEVPGAESAGTGRAHYLVYIGGGRLIKYNPWIGDVSVNVSISPLTTGTYYMNGYALTVQDLGASKGANRYRLINWTTLGPTDNFALRVVNNITWPLSSLGTVDYEAGIALVSSGISSPGAGITINYYLQAVSLKSGAVLWNKTSDTGYGFFSGSSACADHGKYAVLFNDGHFHCWDLYSGSKLWVGELSSWPWGIWGEYGIHSAYGLLIYPQYDGVVARDWETGKVAWHYKHPTPYPYESPYIDETGQSVYSFRTTCRIADGVVYTSNTEHTPSLPLTRGWRLHAINATTGEGIWNITGSMTPGPVADGYLTASNSYDGYMYVFGKGRSITTVTASDKTTAKGETVLIEGTVLDQSPAQLNTPCVSKESMTTYMEFLHMQKPIPSDVTVTGVPVMLLAIDDAGSVIDIGTATSDVSGSFQIEWKPPNEGVYKITATFLGDDSYGTSWAETGLLVGPATAQITFPEQTAPPDYTWTIVGTGIAVIIAVAVAALLVLRKR